MRRFPARHLPSICRTEWRFIHAILRMILPLLPRSILAAVGLVFAAAAAEPPGQPPTGLRVLTAGHSFHVWMPALLAEIAEKAGITGHRNVVLSHLDGSQVSQHWKIPHDKNPIKPALIAPALSATWFPFTFPR